MNDIDNSIIKITGEVEETTDDFIFRTISLYLSEIYVDELVMSKHLISRALHCFKEEHAEEFETLVKESLERTKPSK